MINCLLKAIAIGLMAAAMIFLVFFSLLVIALVLIVVVGLVLAVYFLVVKKPVVENDGTWSLQRIKGKGD